MGQTIDLVETYVAVVAVAEGTITVVDDLSNIVAAVVAVLAVSPAWDK